MQQQAATAYKDELERLEQLRADMFRHTVLLSELVLKCDTACDTNNFTISTTGIAFICRQDIPTTSSLCRIVDCWIRTRHRRRIFR